MSSELVNVSAANGPVIVASASLPELVERAGGAARFAWDEFFYAEHHNPHTQKAYHAGGEGVPGLGRGAGGRAGRRSRRAWSASTSSAWAARLPSGTCTCRRYAASSTGWSTGMSCILNPAASVKGVKDQVIEGKTPEITIEQARTLLASVDTGHVGGPA